MVHACVDCPSRPKELEKSDCGQGTGCADDAPSICQLAVQAQPAVPRQSSGKQPPLLKPSPGTKDFASMPQPDEQINQPAASKPDNDKQGPEVLMHSVSDEETDTVPFVYSNLARKALEGRQSLAPPKVCTGFSIFICFSPVLHVHARL